MTMMVRTTSDPSSLVIPLRNEMRMLNKEVPGFAVQTMSDRIGGQLAAELMIAVLLSIFALENETRHKEPKYKAPKYKALSTKHKEPNTKDQKEQGIWKISWIH